jgi:hypothetical protein
MTSICTYRQKTLASLFHEQCLKPLGFKKYGTTWNKYNDNGFIYIVNFQNRFGNLGSNCLMTVNLGVYIPILHEVPVDRYAKEYDGDYRQRLGVLAMGKDIWWELSEDTEELCRILKDLYHLYVAAWFATYSTYDTITEWWQSLDEENQTAMGTGLTMAQLFTELREKEKARMLFERLIQRYQYERPHSKSFIVNKALSHGIKIELDD